MDPNETLAMIRELVRAGHAGKWSGTDARELVDLTQALDDWLTRGGFLPDAWDHGECSPDARYRALVQRFPNVTDAEENELDELRERLGLPDPFVPES